MWENEIWDALLRGKQDAFPAARPPRHQPACVSNLFQYKIVFAYNNARILEVRVTQSYNLKLIFSPVLWRYEKYIPRMVFQCNS